MSSHHKIKKTDFRDRLLVSKNYHQIRKSDFGDSFILSPIYHQIKKIDFRDSFNSNAVRLEPHTRMCDTKTNEPGTSLNSGWFWYWQRLAL